MEKGLHNSEQKEWALHRDCENKLVNIIVKARSDLESDIAFSVHSYLVLVILKRTL